jgi:uncharacterized protein YggE
MRRRTLPALALILAGAVALLSACAPTTTVTAPGGAAARTVSVAATGTAEATPDAARASITVESTDPSSAQVAQAAAAEATTLALDELKAAGVDAKDIATQAISVGPLYDYTSEGGQTLIGYRASQTLTVTLRDLATAGATLDAVVKAGGNSVRIDSLEPFVTDPAAATEKARAQAVDIARAQAEQYAQLLGFTLGPVATVSEATSNGPMPQGAYAEAAPSADKDVPTPIEAGTTEVTVTLNVAWLIED